MKLYPLVAPTIFCSCGLDLRPIPTSLCEGFVERQFATARVGKHHWVSLAMVRRRMRDYICCGLQNQNSKTFPLITTDECMYMYHVCIVGIYHDLLKPTSKRSSFKTGLALTYTYAGPINYKTGPLFLSYSYSACTFLDLRPRIVV